MPDKILLEHVLTHLDVLVRLQGESPRADLAPDGAMAAYLKGALQGWSFASFASVGEQCALLATRGEPRVLVHCHLDALQVCEGWTRDPFALSVGEGQVVGLGVCDTRAAAACILAAAQVASRDCALLFTSSEAINASACVPAFIEEHGLPYELVVVAQPTLCRAVLEHRGVVMGEGIFNGVPGHASQARALVDSAAHEAMRWGARALELATSLEHQARYHALSGVGFNLGRVEGGSKHNQIASAMQVEWVLRPLPNQSPEALAARFQALAQRPWRVTWRESFHGPTLPAALGRGQTGAARVERARLHAIHYELDVSDAVNFWTEASLFSQAGVDALALGPGDIARAHTPDEWIPLTQLVKGARAYARLMR